MATIITTGFNRVNNGDTTYLDLARYSELISARVRWRGVNSSSTSSSYNQNTGGTSTFFPSTPSGYTFDYCWGRVSMTIKNTGATSAQFRIGGYCGSTYSWGSYVTLSPGQTGTAYWSYTSSSSGTIGQYIMLVGEDLPPSYDWIDDYTFARTYGTTEVDSYTSNPRVTIQGQATQYSGILTGGQISAWQTLYGLQLVNNSLYHTISGSSRADIDIEYTVRALDIQVNIGGTWKSATDGWVNIGGAWKSIDKAWGNIGGVWKEN